MKTILCLLFSTFYLSNKVIAQINQKQIDIFLNDTAIATGHVGISFYDATTHKYLYNYNAEKNFTPSSNVKLFTLYAALKYLGDSLVGITYSEDSANIILYPSADPTLLHFKFNKQPVIDFLKKTNKKIWGTDYGFITKPYGNGWAWDDYAEDFMVERSSLPVYGNLVCFSGIKDAIASIPKRIIEKNGIAARLNTNPNGFVSKVDRSFDKNLFTMYLDGKSKKNIFAPFITSSYLSYQLLSDTIHKQIQLPFSTLPFERDFYTEKKIYSQPTDSLLKLMMHNSDNFFAEQTLLMVSNEKLGYMSDEKIIDTLLKTDLKDIPTKPRWVDGSGLSRYNLFSTKDFVYILNKLKNEFGIDRIKSILPTAGQGTLTNYYQNMAGYIYAKTGSMSNNVSLSGYLFTKNKKLLIFSILVNNYSGTGKAGRKAIEKLLLQIRDNN